MGCCMSTDTAQVRMSKQEAKRRREELASIEAAISSADTNLDQQVSIEELEAMCRNPDVLRTLAKLRGKNASDTDPKQMARMLLRRFDASATASLNMSEVQAMKQELRMMATEAFYVFLDHAVTAPGQKIQGVVVLFLEQPLAASTVTVTLQCQLQCDFTQPVTRRRTVRRRNAGKKRETYTEFVPKSARQNLVELPVNLFLPPGQVLPPGLHRWPFTFIVPENAIASFGFSATGVCTQGNGETSAGNASLAYTVTAATMAPHNGVATEVQDRNAKTSLVASFAVRTPMPPAAPASDADAQFFSPREDQAVAQVCCCCLCRTAPSITFSSAFEVPGVTEWIAGMPVIQPGSHVFGVAKMAQVRGSRIKSWSSMIDLRTQLELNAMDMQWIGQTVHTQVGAEGGPLDASDSVLKMDAVYPGGAVPLRSQLVNCTPQVHMQLSPASSVACSKFPAASTAHVLPFYPGQGRAAVYTGPAFPDSLEPRPPTSAPDAETSASAPHDDASADAQAWWDSPETTVVTDATPASSNLVPGSAAPPMEAAPYPTYTYPAPPTATPEVNMSAPAQGGGGATDTGDGGVGVSADTGAGALAL